MSSSKQENRDSVLSAFSKRLIIFIMDFCLISIANLASCFITQEGHITASTYAPIALSYVHLFSFGLIACLVNYSFGLYRSVWKFAGIDEIMRALCAGTINSLILFGIDRIIYGALRGFGNLLPFYAYLLAWVLICFVTTISRVAFRILRRTTNSMFNINRKNKRVMIVGAGFMGNFVIDALTNEEFKQGRPVVAVDDNPAKKNKKINGVRVAGTCADIPVLAEKFKIDQIIICIPSAPKSRQKEVIELSITTECEVKISPSMDEMFEQGGRRRVRKVNIEDLLSRPEVKLDKKVCRYLIGTTILVTGGGGSIGSEICTQVARYNPKTIVIFDIYENCAFELANELKDKYNEIIDIQVRIGSVRDIPRIKEVMEEFHPDVVFHAAAHKHVPLMEDSPCEAVKNNVFGTYNVALVADEYKVKKMVILSTDKAVNPTNVMGCTKRITEIIVQYMNNKSQNTMYAAVRFGNVLGSRGSVIPIFKKQIEKGGPIKLTHPDITRYFMTIPEAAQLVCQAGGLANGGEIFVLDMGEPVRIMDLAKNLIRLSGFTEEEIGIEIVGLRPGEKLYEELSMNEELETRQKTANEKIYVNQPIDMDETTFTNLMEELSDIDDSNVREKLMSFIPNYHPAENCPTE